MFFCGVFLETGDFTMLQLLLTSAFALVSIAATIAASSACALCLCAAAPWLPTALAAKVSQALELPSVAKPFTAQLLLDVVA